MLGIPRRYRHFIFTVIQSGLTCFIAAGIASLPSLMLGNVLHSWLSSWLIAWATMLPIVVLAAPAIRLLTFVLTRDERANLAALCFGEDTACIADMEGLAARAPRFVKSEFGVQSTLLGLRGGSQRFIAIMVPSVSGSL